MPTLIHCALRTQIPRISCYTKLLIVVKGFSKDLVLVRTVQAIRSKKMSSVRTALAIRWKKKCHPFERLRLSVREKLSSVGKNCHPFARLGLSVRRKLLSVRTARAIRLKQLSATLLFKVTFTRAVCDETVKKIM